MMQKIYVIKTRNGKYASIEHTEYFIFVSESNTLISNVPFTIFESREKAVKELIELNQEDDIIYYDDDVYLSDVVELVIKLEIEEV